MITAAHDDTRPRRLRCESPGCQTFTTVLPSGHALCVRHRGTITQICKACGQSYDVQDGRGRDNCPECAAMKAAEKGTNFMVDPTDGTIYRQLYIEPLPEPSKASGHAINREYWLPRHMGGAMVVMDE